MATGNQIYGAKPDSRPPPAYPGEGVAQRQTGVRTESKATAQAEAAGSTFEVVGGGGAVVLGILGLAGFYPSTFAEISAIAVGGGLMSHGIAATIRWRNAFRRAGHEHVAQAAVGSETVCGAAGIALGILALVGVIPMTLMAVSAIVLGGALLLAAPAEPELVGDASNERIVQATRAGGGIEAMAGVGAIVLGILALLGIGSTVTLTLVSMIGLGGGLLLAGGALAAIFTRRALHPQHS